MQRNDLRHHSSNYFQERSVGPAGNPQSTRLTLRNYFADIVVDQSAGATVVHWVVQRIGAREVLALGQEDTFELALQNAHECLKNMANHSRQRAAVYHFDCLKK